MTESNEITEQKQLFTTNAKYGKKRRSKRNSKWNQNLNQKKNIVLVLDYCEHDLLGLLARKVRFNNKQLRSLFHQSLSALSFIHSHGIIHNDLKSANLLLNNQG